MTGKPKLWSGFECLGLSFLLHILVVLVIVLVGTFCFTDYVNKPTIEIELVKVSNEDVEESISKAEETGGMGESLPAFTSKPSTPSLFQQKKTETSGSTTGEVLAEDGGSSHSYGVEGGGSVKGNPSGSSKTNNEAGNATGGNGEGNSPGGKTTSVNWKARFANLVERNKSFPNDARREGVTGVVKLRVVISPSGNLIQNDIRQSSGDRRLDRAAQEAVINSMPFPHDSGGNLEMILPIRFQFTG